MLLLRAASLFLLFAGATSLNGTLTLNGTSVAVALERNSTKGILHHPISSHTCGVHEKVSSVNGSEEAVVWRMRPLRIVIVITSDKYLAVLLNWLLFFHELCPDQSSLYFMCTDKQAEPSMRKVGLECHYAHTLNLNGPVPSTANNNNKLWLVRARLAKTLLDQGFDVLMSDADALWLQNPFDELERFSSSDIIASRGRFPEDASRIYGATLCMGFIYIKSTRRTQIFYAQLVDYMTHQAHPDDQRDINQLLLQRGLIYPPPASRPLKYIDATKEDHGYVFVGSGGPRYVVSAAKDREANTTLRITLLPHTAFRRICEGQRLASIHEAVVAHCYSELKTGEGKVIAGRKYSLWVLRDDWERVRYTNTDEYLARIAVSLDTKVAGAGARRLLLPSGAPEDQYQGRGKRERRRRNSRFAICRAAGNNGSASAGAGGVPAICLQRVHSFGRNMSAADVASLEARGHHRRVGSASAVPP